MNTEMRNCLAAAWLLCGSSLAQAELIVNETFTDYPDNALISASPAGWALGLVGDWVSPPDNYFYVNRTQADLDAGTGKAVYDMPYDDNGAREASRAAADDFVLFSQDGDTFYASFLILPGRAAGHMYFTLVLDRADGGGQLNVSFGMSDGRFTVGNDGTDVDVAGGVPVVEEMLVVLRVEYGDGATGPDDNEIVTVWVNPLSPASDAVIDQVPVDFLNRGGGKLAGVAIRGEHMSGHPAFFDNLRVGTGFYDVVLGLPPGSEPNGLAINGLFYDPANPGHGFDFNVHEAGFTLYYYGHTASGERLWLVSGLHPGDLQYGLPIELNMYEVAEGVFGNPGAETFWGTITVTLSDCASGHASFDGLDGQLEMDFIRLVGLPGMVCN